MKDPGFSSLNILPSSGREGGRNLDFSLYKSFLYVIREGEEVCEETTKTIVLDRPEENCSLDPQGTIYCFLFGFLLIGVPVSLLLGKVH